MVPNSRIRWIVYLLSAVVREETTDFREKGHVLSLMTNKPVWKVFLISAIEQILLSCEIEWLIPVDLLLQITKTY